MGMDDEEVRRVQMVQAGRWLRERRDELGFTQKAFADAVPIDQSQLSKIERGLGEITPDRAAGIARVLGLPEIEVWKRLGLRIPSGLPEGEDDTRDLDARIERLLASALPALQEIAELQEERRQRRADDDTETA